MRILGFLIVLYRRGMSLAILSLWSRAALLEAAGMAGVPEIPPESTPIELTPVRRGNLTVYDSRMKAADWCAMQGPSVQSERNQIAKLKHDRECAKYFIR